MIRILLILLVSASVMHACSLPVFRYALENWEADHHVLMLPNDTADAEKKWWDDFLKNGDFTYEVTEIADDDMPAGLYFPKGFGPWLTYDKFKDNDKLDDGFLSKQWSSPSSQKVIDGIMRGDSVIFLLSGGDEKARQAAEEKMRPRVKTLLEYIQLADDVVESWQNFHQPPDEFYTPPRGHVSSPIPLGMAVSFIQLKDEEALAKQIKSMFLAEELEEKGEDKGVRVTVVFGRGRAIPVAHIDEINKALIDDVIHFVTGACSCKIKEENPGHDLMLPIYWDDKIWEASSKLTGKADNRILGKMLDPASLNAEESVEAKPTDQKEEPEDVVITPDAPVKPLAKDAAPVTEEVEAPAGGIGFFPLLLMVGLVFIIGIVVVTRARG